MRMDAALPETAADLLQHSSEETLAKLFWVYGEQPGARRIARRIVERRRRNPIRTTHELAELLGPKRGPIHPATRVFQALRIAVNQELDRLSRFLDKFPMSLNNGGRAVVISYHSLEDRLVKKSFRSWSDRGWVERVSIKPVRPLREEILENPRSRSAKLRIVERMSTPEVDS